MKASTVGLLLLALPAPALAEITLFAAKGHGGAQLALVRAESNIRFSPRSAQLEGGGWELCPRPFYGGACVRVEASQSDLRLPRGFSGVVQSARPLPDRPAAADPQPDTPDQP